MNGLTFICCLWVALSVVCNPSAVSAFELLEEQVEQSDSQVTERWYTMRAEEGDWISKLCLEFDQPLVCVEEVKVANPQLATDWCAEQWGLCEGEVYLLPWHESLSEQAVVSVNETAPIIRPQPRPDNVEVQSQEQTREVIVSEPLQADVGATSTFWLWSGLTSLWFWGALIALIVLLILCWVLLVLLPRLLPFWVLPWSRLRFVSCPDFNKTSNHSCTWTLCDGRGFGHYVITITTRRDASKQLAYQWNVPLDRNGKLADDRRYSWSSKKEVAKALRAAYRKGRLATLRVKPAKASQVQ